MKIAKSVHPLETVERGILLGRGQKVILDADLAELYGVTTKRLNQQVSRNRGRFPEDFVFQLSADEKAEVVANCDHLSKPPDRLPFMLSRGGRTNAPAILCPQP
jgi:hypothetical protein